jgi:general secretion pathway protein A
MYKDYFGLTEAPFSIAPDPRYLYLSDKHRDALAHLIYGVGDQGGFVLLTGEVGTGKTTLCRCLLQQIPDNVDVAYIINPKLSSNQLLQSIFTELGISYRPAMTSKDLIDELNRYLLDAHSRGRNTILVIDEAQNLASDILEQLRLLTNLETNEKKLLQLVLIGQPELSDLLDKKELRQLAQRVTARYHLTPLSKAEVTHYIQHRLSVAGCKNPIFPASSIRRVYKLTKGVPRLINLLCGRTLLGMYSTDSHLATVKIVNKAAGEIFAKPRKTSSQWTPLYYAIALGLVIVVSSYLWKNPRVEVEMPTINSGEVTQLTEPKLESTNTQVGSDDVLHP